MPKGKNMTKSKKDPDYFTRSDVQVRPVEVSDTWCQFYDFRKAKKAPANSNAPWGYVMMIPNYRDGMKIKPEGYVVRTKLCKKEKMLLLQIVTGKKWSCEGRFYGTVMRFPEDSASKKQKTKEPMKPKKGKKDKKKSSKRSRRRKRYFNIQNWSK